MAARQLITVALCSWSHTLSDLPPSFDRKAQERIHNPRVVAATGSASDLGRSLLERKRPAIRPVGGHCVERVGDSEDPRPQGNLRSSQALGVTAAILAFM